MALEWDLRRQYIQKIVHSTFHQNNTNIKFPLHAKVGSIKNRNGMDLTEAEDIKSQTSWNVKSSGPQKGSLQTKLVEMIEFQLSYFKSWKMMLWKCCTQYASKFGKLNSGHRTGKGQFSFQSQRKALPKNAQTTAQLHSSHMLVK